jgi:RNA polymerase sigma factor (sigma-70 family)
MQQTTWLAERFEAERNRLQNLAYRMLGSRAEAEDAVQEAWLRLSRADADQVENLSGWLTTVVSRVCLDQLRTQRFTAADPLDDEHLEETPSASEAGPESEAVLGESVGLALLVVLDALEPAERVAFVLHDMFAIPFDEIAHILDRSPAAARQLASRARRRVQGAETSGHPRVRQRQVVEAFLAASRQGEFDALLALLDPEVVLRADRVALSMSEANRARGVEGAPELSAEIRGARAVARTFSGRAAAARPALIDGWFGATWAPGGRPRVVFRFTTDEGRITSIELIAEPQTIGALDLVLD